MRIVINAALLPKIYSAEYVYFLAEMVRKISSIHAEHRFIIICEIQQAGQFTTGKNVEIVATKTRIKNALIWKYWYDVRIPVLLRKHKADLFFSLAGICSINTKIPQCIFINDLSFLHNSSIFSRSQTAFLQGRLKKSVSRAQRIITFSASIKQEIAQQFGVSDKTDLVQHWVADDTAPQPEQIVEQTKLTYSDGKEFFLYAGPIHPSGNLINLLKAYSLFKKRQQSSLKLILCGTDITGYPTLPKLLHTYKYKKDVRLLEKADALTYTNLLSSAYALLYPALSTGLLQPAIDALQKQLPVIIADHPVAKELLQDAALYVAPENPQAIAESMMRIYKDERLRNELIEKGKDVIRDLTDKNLTADQLWHSLQKAHG